MLGERAARPQVVEVVVRNLIGVGADRLSSAAAVELLIVGLVTAAERDRVEPVAVVNHSADLLDGAAMGRPCPDHRPSPPPRCAGARTDRSESSPCTRSCSPPFGVTSGRD